MAKICTGDRPCLRFVQLVPQARVRSTSLSRQAKRQRRHQPRARFWIARNKTAPAALPDRDSDRRRPTNRINDYFSMSGRQDLTCGHHRVCAARLGSDDCYRSQAHSQAPKSVQRHAVHSGVPVDLAELAVGFLDLCRLLGGMCVLLEQHLVGLSLGVSHQLLQIRPRL